MRKLLVAYDGSEPAQRALEQAAELAQALGPSITVVKVDHHAIGRAAVNPWDAHDIRSEDLREAGARLAERGITVDLLEPAGNPASLIVEMAEEGGFDAIVMGSRGLGVVEGLLLGSVSEHVVSHARQTIILVH